QFHPVMFVLRPYGACWRSKRSIRKTPERDSDVLGPKVQRPINGASAIRTEIVGQSSLRALDRTLVRFRRTGKPDIFFVEIHTDPERTACAPLALSTVTLHGEARFRFGCGGNSTACALRDTTTCGHGSPRWMRFRSARNLFRH